MFGNGGKNNNLFKSPVNDTNNGGYPPYGFNDTTTTTTKSR